MRGVLVKDKGPRKIKQDQDPSTQTYKEIAQYRSTFPTHSQTSGKQQITHYGDLTQSQQDPTTQEDETVTKDSKPTFKQYSSEYPVQHHSKLKTLTPMGLTHDVIEQAIKS